MKKWKKTEDLIIGDMVGENILSYPNMEIIASKGDIVSNLMLNRLKTFNISWIEIEDIFSLDDDVKISRIFSEDKIENMRKQVYRVWEEIISDRKINIRKVELLSETFVKEIENKYGDLLAPNLCKVIDFDEYTFSHQINVAVIASLISFEIFEERWEFIKEMATGALIHDIGKVMIPKEILNLKRKLTAEEHDIIKHHVDFGYEMAKFSSVSEDNILDCIKYHHENWNGKGYMYGLKEESIPLPGRILAVADVYDALTTRRPYKNAWTPYQAISYIIQKSGRIFDPNVVESFLRVFGIYPVGTSLRLSSGEKAVVVANNRNAIASPVVIISKDEGFKRINLATQKNLYIAEILENTYSNIQIYNRFKVTLARITPFLKNQFVNKNKRYQKGDPMLKKTLFNSAIILLVVISLTSCFRTNIPEKVKTPGIVSPTNGELVEENNIYLRWTTSFEEGKEGEYRVYYSQEAENMEDYFTVDTNHFPTLNLKAGVWYWKVEAVGNGGVKVASPVWSFTVDGANLPQIAPDEIPPVDPSLIVSEIEDTSFTLAWTKYEDLQNPDKEINYTVYLYKQNGSAPRNAEEMMRGNPDYTVNTTDTSHRFENMGSRTRYNFTIIAQNSVGNTAEVGTSDVVTGNRAPGAFDIITPEEGAQDVVTAAELEWEASVDPDGDAVRYYVYLDTVKDTNRMVGPTDGISETQYTPAILEKGKTYYWTIVAKDSNGAATQTYQHTFRTVSEGVSYPATPTPADGMQNADMENGLTLSWECAEEDAVYDVYLGSKRNEMGKIAGNTLQKEYTVNSGLTAAKTYYWKVVAKKNGESAESETWSFKTAELTKANITSAKTNTDGTEIEMGFDKLMADPTGKHGLFRVERQDTQNSEVRSLEIETTAIGMKPGDGKSYILTLGSEIANGENVFVTYASDEIKGANGGKLNGFEDYPVVNRVPGEKPVCVAATTTEDMKHIEIRFDKEMEDPAGKKEQFGVLVNGYVNEVENVEMKTGSASKTYVLSLKEAMGKNNLVHVSYTRGDVKAVNGAELETFVNRPVVNTATVLVVNKNVSWNYVTISSAIKAAVNGDTIIVYPGTYKESISYDGKSVIVRSTMPSSKIVVESTIIDAETVGPAVRFMNGENRDSRLIGLTIRNGNAVPEYTSTERRAYELGGGITIQNASPTIINNIIENNTSVSGGGILVIGGSPLIVGNLIKGNKATEPDYSGSRLATSAYGGGICFFEYSYGSGARKANPFNPIVYSNELSENEAVYGVGIYVGEGYALLNSDMGEWKHFNSPYSEVSFVENTDEYNNKYTDNVLTNVRRIAENTDGRDIAYYAKTTTAGILDLRPASGTEKDDIIMNIDYVAGCEYNNGIVTFSIPKEFKVTTDATVRIGDGELRKVESGEINEDITGNTVTVGGISLSENSTVTLTLEEQKIPTGIDDEREADKRNSSYEFSVKGDADSVESAWRESSVSEDSFVSFNLSECADIKIRPVLEKVSELSDLTEISGSIQLRIDTYNSKDKKISDIVNSIESLDGSTQTYSVYKSDGVSTSVLAATDSIPQEATLTVTAERGNKKEYSVYKSVGEFLLVESDGSKTYHLTFKEALNDLGSGESGRIYIATDTVAEGEQFFVDSGKELRVSPRTGIDSITFDGESNHRLFAVTANSSVTVERSVIINGYDFAGAGLLVETGSTLTTLDSTVTGNSAVAAGGGVLISESAYFAVNTVISGNNSGQLGGGVYSAGLFETDNATISDNSSGQLGGGVYCQKLPGRKNEFKSNDTVISGNASSQGGGVYVDASAVFNPENTVINRNTAYEGGGIYLYESLFFSKNSTITENSATAGNGGGIFEYGSFTHATETSISSNTSAVDGGGIYGTGIRNFCNVLVEDNHAGNNGGGISNSFMMTIVDSVVRNNHAGNNGGGIYTDCSEVHDFNINSAEIYSNQAGNEGGGIYSLNGNVLKTNGNLWNDTPVDIGQAFSVDSSGNILTSPDVADPVQLGENIAGNSNTNQLGR